ANFRDLSSAVTRMATLSPGGRITVEVVDEEIARLRAAWQEPVSGSDEVLADIVGPEGLAELDLFDRVQLAEAVRVCRASRSLAEAGRKLFAVSRQKKKSANDADRIRKYLASFGLDWATVGAAP
ncbi:MAG TPA: transcriptional regulator, partial [Acidobacteria bacterium]|nr:transcriptional regulator [Acidobacteriota bacterium]